MKRLMKMSVIFTDEIGWVISHNLFVKNIYQEVSDGTLTCGLEFEPALFKIHTPFKNTIAVKSGTPSTTVRRDSLQIIRTKKRRRTLSSNSKNTNNSAENEINLVIQKFSALCDAAVRQGIFINPPLSLPTQGSNEEARDLSIKFYKDNSDEQSKVFHGANNCDVPIIVFHGEKKYVFPPKCLFFNNDISNLNQKLSLLGEYDFILLDPPWWNKYIRRKRQKCHESSYSMIYSEELSRVPVVSLTAPGALIAVWCTNCEAHINTLKNDIFPLWGVQYIGKWYWVKITQSGEPVCNFSEPTQKQPFEQILFACNLGTSRDFPLPENGKVVVSVPSAIHSHKPPLIEILSAYLPSNPKCLELFARYLLPSYTSWGKEVLKLQNLSLYCTYEMSHEKENTQVVTNNLFCN